MGLIPTSCISSKFLFHWMQTLDLRGVANDSGAVPSIRKSEIANVLVPLPSLEEQVRIVEPLDRFDAIVNDLSIGLPAEIIARRKQFDYYRHKLLTFEEAD